MIKNPKYLQRWEDEQARNTPVDFQKNLKLVEAMLKEARSLGVFPSNDPWEDFEVDLRIARAINAV